MGADHTGFGVGRLGDVLPDPFGDSEGVVNQLGRSSGAELNFVSTDTKGYAHNSPARTLEVSYPSLFESCTIGIGRHFPLLSPEQQEYDEFGFPISWKTARRTDCVVCSSCG